MTSAGTRGLQRQSTPMRHSKRQILKLKKPYPL